MSDNRYFSYNCPALMQDGRFITNFTRHRVVDQYIRNVNNITSAQDYKDFLQNNGDIIINRERAYNDENNICKLDGKCLSVGLYPSNMPQNVPASMCTPKS